MMVNDQFNAEMCAQYAESLVHMDEVERALLVLDNVPAYYRDNPPEILKKLRADILKALCTTHAYMVSGLDTRASAETGDAWISSQLRGILLEQEVSRYNEEGLTPHIFDMGPGEYGAPIGLAGHRRQFTYDFIGLDGSTMASAKPLLEGISKKRGDFEPVIFLGLELIEHLPSPQDLAVECLRHCGGWPDRIHLSTPQYTFDVRQKNWRKPCGLPHLRAYTPAEFITAAAKIFPGYSWQMYPSQLTSLRGMRSDKIDHKPLLQSEKF